MSGRIVYDVLSLVVAGDGFVRFAMPVNMTPTNASRKPFNSRIDLSSSGTPELEMLEPKNQTRTKPKTRASPTRFANLSAEAMRGLDLGDDRWTVADRVIARPWSFVIPSNLEFLDDDIRALCTKQVAMYYRRDP